MNQSRSDTEKRCFFSFIASWFLCFCTISPRNGPISNFIFRRNQLDLPKHISALSPLPFHYSLSCEVDVTHRETLNSHMVLIVGSEKIKLAWERSIVIKRYEYLLLNQCVLNWVENSWQLYVNSFLGLKITQSCPVKLNIYLHTMHTGYI